MNLYTQYTWKYLFPLRINSFCELNFVFLKGLLLEKYLGIHLDLNLNILMSLNQVKKILKLNSSPRKLTFIIFFNLKIYFNYFNILI